MEALSSILFTQQSAIILLGLIGLGYVLRSIPQFPNAYIGVCVTILSLVLTYFILKKSIAESIAYGLTYSAFSSLAYEQVLKFINNWISSKFNQK